MTPANRLNKHYVKSKIVLGVLKYVDILGHSIC